MRFLTAVVVLAAMGAPALADLPILFEEGIDLDSNGDNETQFSKIAVALQNQAPGMNYRVEFDYAFLSSEGVSADGGIVNDVFIIDLFIGQGPPVGRISGAVVDGPGYGGSFAEYNTLVGTVSGDPSPPNHIPGTQHAPAGGPGLMFPVWFDDAGVGWRTGSFIFAGSASVPQLEFLVADSSDLAVESGLAVDNIRVVELGEVDTLVWNESFEGPDPLLGRGMGNTGVYDLLTPLDPPVIGEGGGPLLDIAAALPPAFGPSDGATFALAATYDIPEPTSVALLALGAVGLTRRRRA